MTERRKLPLVSVVIPTYNRKAKLVRLINSLLKSDYPRLEIIVIDDCSSDGTYRLIKKLFPTVKIIRNNKEMFVSATRNIGLKSARGEYIFLIDDDNVVDRACISRLVDVMESHKSVGIVAPLCFYFRESDIISNAGEIRNMWSSINKILYRYKTCHDGLPELIECMCVGNAFMVRKKIANIVFFDEKGFPFQHEDLDFCLRVLELGYKVVCCTKAKIWHDIPIKWSNFLEKTNITNCIKAYLIGRNRIILQRRHSNYTKLILFILVALPLITLYHSIGLLLDSTISVNERFKLIGYYLLGTICGLFDTYI